MNIDNTTIAVSPFPVFTTSPQRPTTVKTYQHFTDQPIDSLRLCGYYLEIHKDLVQLDPKKTYIISVSEVLP